MTTKQDKIKEIEPLEMKGLKGLSAWMVYNKIAFHLIYIRMFNMKTSAVQLGVDALEAIIESDDTKEEKFDKLANLMPAVVESLIPNDHIPTQEEVLAYFKEADEEERAAMLFEALGFIELEEEDRLKLLSLHKDGNGIHYSKVNIKNIEVGKMVDMMMQTLLACSDVTVDMSLVSDKEKDALGKYRVDVMEESADILANNPDTSTSDVLSFGFKKALSKIGL